MTTASIRPATAEDATLAADLVTASWTREAEDPVIVAYRWSRPRDGWRHGRYIAEVDGRPVAFLEWQHGRFEELPERHCWVEVYLDLAHMDAGLLDELWAWIEQDAWHEGALTLNAACGEDEPEVLAALGRRGYAPKRTDRVWTLDLQKHAGRLTADAAAARQRMLVAGIVLTTLDRWTDPERWPKLHGLSELMRQDVPHTSPPLPQTLEDFRARIEAPNVRWDRYWIALDGTEPVAVSFLSFPPVRGSVWTGFTGSHPRYRGRGIARAVKLQTLAQAAELGIGDVRTDNDSENKPMLHINETLGYELMPGFVSFEKRLPARALR